MNQRKKMTEKKWAPLVMSTTLITTAILSAGGTVSAAEVHQAKNHGQEISQLANSLPGSPDKGSAIHTLAKQINNTAITETNEDELTEQNAVHAPMAEVTPEAPEEEAFVEEPTTEVTPEVEAFVEEPTTGVTSEEEAFVEEPTTEVTSEEEAFVEEPLSEVTPEEEAFVEEPLSEVIPEEEALEEEPTSEVTPEEDSNEGEAINGEAVNEEDDGQSNTDGQGESLEDDKVNGDQSATTVTDKGTEATDQTLEDWVADHYREVIEDYRSLIDHYQTYIDQWFAISENDSTTAAEEAVVTDEAPTAEEAEATTETPATEEAEAETDNSLDQVKSEQKSDSYTAFDKLSGYYQQLLNSYQSFVTLFK